MSILKDVLELARDIKEGEYLDYDDNGVLNLDSIGRKNSISRFSDDSIMQFPVLTSNALSVEDLTMINKALERQFGNFMMVSMNLDNVEVFKGSKVSKIQYIRRFHTNSNRKMGISTIAGHGADLISDSVVEERLILSNKNLLKEYVEDMRMKPLNDLTKFSLLREKIDSMNMTVYPTFDDNNKLNIKPTITASPQLVDNDAKKSNEMIPTLIKVPVTFIQKDTDAMFTTEILIGIKCITHLIPTEEMTYNISKGIEEKRSFFRFIQWTSGEIKFFRDYIFCLDRIKKEAINSRSQSSWWRSLKNRSTIAKIKSFTFAKNNLLPNSTIVVTMDEVEYILNNYGIDLLNDMKTVEKLMSTFFLLGFVIVDSSAEVAYFLFDGEISYQTYSFKSLEKENSNAKRDMKELMSLANNFR